LPDIQSQTNTTAGNVQDKLTANFFNLVSSSRWAINSRIFRISSSFWSKIEGDDGAPGVEGFVEAGEK